MDTRESGIGIDNVLGKPNLILEEIAKFIKQVDYGEVVITIHDKEVVQIEKREKKRFNIKKRLHKQS